MLLSLGFLRVLKGLLGWFVVLVRGFSVLGLLNFKKFTKNYTKTFTFFTSIISLPGKTKHLKTSGTQIFVNEQGTLGPGALYKLRYIFDIVTIIMSFLFF